jgi:hypothetical protein
MAANIITMELKEEDELLKTVIAHYELHIKKFQPYKLKKWSGGWCAAANSKRQCASADAALLLMC